MSIRVHLWPILFFFEDALMRILHLDAGREMRGGQWQVLRLIEGLAAAGVESILMARENAPRLATTNPLRDLCLFVFICGRFCFPPRSR